jgi:hypothetical protein
VSWSIREENLDALLKTIAETLSISPETVRTHMLRRRDTFKSVLWIPQVLGCELEYVRLTMCLALLPKLHKHA